MSMDQVAFGSPGQFLRLRVRELNGFDEQSISGLDTATAIDLIDRLLVRPPGSPVEHFKAAELTGSERDQLLAEIYERTFGPRIESAVRCVLCEELFDLTFSIRDLLVSLDSDKSSTSVTHDTDGTYRLANGLRFRLPVGTDELAVVGLSPEAAQLALLQRCILESNESVEIDDVQEAMEEVGPVMDLELDARCPECGGKQPVHFDIQSYLLRALLQERRRIGREIHRLAVAYGWSLNEILSLPRSQRQAFVEFIEVDFSPRQNSRSFA